MVASSGMLGTVAHAPIGGSQPFSARASAILRLRPPAVDRMVAPGRAEMIRVILGWVLIVHALAHVSADAWISLDDPVWFTTTVCAVAFAGYVSTGLALFRLPLLRDHWKATLLAASLASISFIVWTRPVWGMLGAAIDIAVFLVVIDVMQPRIDSSIEVIEAAGVEVTGHPRRLKFAWTLGVLFLVYGTAAILARPTMLHWGSTPRERTSELPGDDLLADDATYRIDHAITINAPAHAVWPWLVQLGQDRGGFYSYDWLERAVGDRVHNADRIDPAWQRRAAGDTVLATQRDYFGGRLGTLGWEVTRVEPNRVLALDKWGNFVLAPIDSSTTRLIVRTRGASRVTVLGFVLAPLEVLVFEPVHFAMERAMLRGIRERAERYAIAR
jgi:hypothetical protein